MVNCRISPDRKACALNLWDLGWEIEDICFAQSVSRSSLYRWRNIFVEHGNVNRPPSPLVGRTRIITRAVLTAVRTIYEEEPDLYLDELCTFLTVEHNIIVSSSTLSWNLIEAGLTRKKLHKLALERDEILRDEWKESLRNDYTGEGIEFVCLNETSKNDHTYARKFGRAMSGEQAGLKDVFVHGDRYSLLAAITTEGYIATRVVPGSFDSFEFYNFIAEEVVCIAHSHISSIYC
jgi:transposase